MNRRTACLSMLAVTALVSCGHLHAATPTAKHAVTLQVKEIHCATCARKLASRLYTVPGVVNVKTNLKKNLVVVIPEKDRQLSPKAVWEAVEAVELKPVKLRVANTTYMKKPKR